MNEMSGEQITNLESGQRMAKKQGDATFMTSVENPGLQTQKTKGPRNKKEFGEDAQLSRTQGKEQEEA